MIIISLLKTEIVNPIRPHLLKRDMYTGFVSVKMRSHLRLIRDKLYRINYLGIKS